LRWEGSADIEVEELAYFALAVLHTATNERAIAHMVMKLA